MNVILLTVFIGLVLVFFFVFLFVHQARATGRVVNERDALLPLEEEKVIRTDSKVVESTATKEP